MAEAAGHDVVRAQWFQQCINRRAAELGLPPCSTARLDQLYDLWHRTRWAPLDGAIEEILRPAEVIAVQEHEHQLQLLLQLGLDAWLIRTAAGRGMSAAELQAALDTKVARWSTPVQQLPERALVPESLAYTLRQYEELGRQVRSARGLW